MDDKDNNVVALDAWRNRAKDTGAKTAPQNNAVPSAGAGSSQDSLRSFVRTAGGENWAGKFAVQTPDGKESEQNMDVKGFATVLGTFDIQKVLSRLVMRNERKIQEYKSLVQGYSDENLQGWLEKPKDSDLQRKPYFFHALVDEAKRRFLFAKTGDEPPE